MVKLDILKREYPLALQGFEQEILREYLQCVILEILFDSHLGRKFCFLGGTCLRLIHNNTRFSEDLDFDNFLINPSDFDDVKELVSKGLSKQGYVIEIESAGKNAFRLDIKFPAVLYDLGLSNHKAQKLLIQLDTEAQHFDFTPEQHIISRLGVFSQIQTTPLDLILAQKFYAILNRPRNKGRDFFDVVFIMGQGIKPNYAYLNQKLGIKTSEQLKERILGHCEKLNMEEQADDVRRFLFNPSDTKMIVLFNAYIKQTVL
jgi:predicted nucleotidyltransferase component of viral defense system